MLLVRRPAKGLLGGMLAFPTGPWMDEAEAGIDAPEEANWDEAGWVDHVFTHFALRMRLLCARTPERAPEGSWWPVGRLAEAGLPTLFAKLAERGACWSAAQEVSLAAGAAPA